MREHEVLEKIFRVYIGIYGLDKVMVGIHNAMCHGGIVDCTDKQLGKFYKHLDKALKVSKKMGNSDGN